MDTEDVLGLPHVCCVTACAYTHTHTQSNDDDGGGGGDDDDNSSNKNNDNNRGNK